ncbi:hypothetical protein PYCC9005_005003 [Savitreella phatthalungensis]
MDVAQNSSKIRHDARLGAGQKLFASKTSMSAPSCIMREMRRQPRAGLRLLHHAYADFSHALSPLPPSIKSYKRRAATRREVWSSAVMFAYMLAERSCQLELMTAYDMTYGAVAQGAHLMVKCTPGPESNYGYHINLENYAIQEMGRGHHPLYVREPGDEDVKIIRYVGCLEVGYRLFSVSGTWTDTVGGGRPQCPREEYWLRSTQARSVTAERSGSTVVVRNKANQSWAHDARAIDPVTGKDAAGLMSEPQVIARVAVQFEPHTAIKVVATGETSDVGVMLWMRFGVPPTVLHPEAALRVRNNLKLNMMLRAKVLLLSAPPPYEPVESEGPRVDDVVVFQRDALLCAAMHVLAHPAIEPFWQLYRNEAEIAWSNRGCSSLPYLYAAGIHSGRLFGPARDPFADSAFHKEVSSARATYDEPSSGPADSLMQGHLEALAERARSRRP